VNEILQTQQIMYLRHLRLGNFIITICCTCGIRTWEPLLHNKFWQLHPHSSSFGKKKKLNSVRHFN